MTAIAPNSLHARDIAYLVHPQTNLVAHETQGPLVITRGQGIYVYDDTGHEFLDAAAGLWCASLGFASERLAKVAYEQMRTLGYYQTFQHNSTEAGIDLAEALIKLAPVPMSKVMFQCSGSEANDTAIKLVWYYHAAIGKPEKRKIIGRKGSYHGTTSVAISASGRPDMHADFGLPFEMFRHTEFPYYYRHRQEGESEEAFATRMAKALEDLILAEGPETVGGFIAEPVQAGSGAILPPRGYFEKVQAILKRYEILFIADEVICGFARTGRMWGCETYGLTPDMITCAKALSGAMQPISALMVNEKVYQAMLAQSRKLGRFAHGFTHAGHPVATAVAREVLRIYEEMDVVAHATRVGGVMQRALARFADHPLVGEVRGVGLLGGLELVADKRTRAMHDPGLKVRDLVDAHTRANGLIVRPVGNCIALSPPLIITEAEVEDMIARLGVALDRIHAELAAR